MPAKIISWHVQIRALQKTFVISCILLIPCGTVWARDIEISSAPRKHLGFHLGGGIASYREDLLIPLGFHGPGLSLGGIFSQQNKNDLIQLRLTVGFGHLENRYSHEAWALMQELRLSWLRKLIGHQKYGDFWGGISLPLEMNNLLFSSWDDAHLYWLTVYGLAAAVQCGKKVSSNNNVSLRIEIPFFGWISRPPTYRYKKQEPLNHFTHHFTEPNKSLHFETMNTYQNIFIQLLLTREMRRSLFNVGLELQYSYCRRPEKIFGMNTFLVLSYQWRIGQ